MKGLYLKRGWYYWQPPTPKSGGKRPGAISLRTKDIVEATRLAVQLSQKTTLENMLSRHSYEEAVSRYLQWAEESGRQSDSTRNASEKALLLVGNLVGNPPVNSIDEKTAKRVESCLREGDALHTVPAGQNKGMRATGRKRSDATVKFYMRIFKGFCSWLVNEGMILRHPMERMKHPTSKKTRRAQFCTIEERELLLENPISREVEFLLMWGFFAGLRLGEMIAMEWDWLWIDGDSGVLVVQETAQWKPKDRERREIPLHPRLITLMKDWKKGDAAFVLRPDRNVWKKPPLYRYNPRHSFNKYVESLGLGWVGYHTLRHSFATHLAMKGTAMSEIAGLLGDGIEVTEKHYVAYAPGSSASISKL